MTRLGPDAAGMALDDAMHDRGADVGAPNCLALCSRWKAPEVLGTQSQIDAAPYCRFSPTLGSRSAPTAWQKQGW